MVKNYSTLAGIKQISVNKFNPFISTDCVVFGFDSQTLRVLLVERNAGSKTFKLPGSLVYNEEDLTLSAHRVLQELTGLHNIFLKQCGVFGDPQRIVSKPGDHAWLQETSGLQIDRVVSIGYYALIKIETGTSEIAEHPAAQWFNLNELPELAFDHADIIRSALEAIRKEIAYEPLEFELLPKKFTLRQWQNLYEAFFDKQLDNRNFRKKVIRLPYIVQLDEKQEKVPHKPALFYKFDKKAYDKFRKENSAYLF